MTRKYPLPICVLILCAPLLLSACGMELNAKSLDLSAQAPAEQNPKPASEPSSAIAPRPGQPAPTSESAPPTKPFSSPATPVRDFPRVASSGRCAPAYKNGTRGTCIDGKPCRGYGIRNDEKQILCMCYLTHDGCDGKSRCDDRAHACVADTRQRTHEE